MQWYVTQAGDVLDAICSDYYKTTTGVVEIVLEYNPLLASCPAILPAGISIYLPPLLNPVSVANTVSLWD